MDIWNLLLRIALTMSWFGFVFCVAVLTHISARLLILVLAGSRKLEDTQETLHRLQEFIPSLHEHELLLQETTEMLKARARALDHLIVEAEREKRSFEHGQQPDKGGG